MSTRRVPRAAARGQGSAPGPRPLFCKKAGQKTFKRQSTSSPSPSPLGRVIQSVREADTLAAEWHLPREWERRVGPETSRGRHHPISVFLWGSTPFLWARPKKWGGTGSTNVKSSRTKRRVPETQRPGGDGPPPLRARQRRQDLLEILRQLGGDDDSLTAARMDEFKLASVQALTGKPLVG